MPEDSLIENREVSEPIKLTAVYSGSSLTATVEPDFHLCEADYLRLTQSRTNLKEWANNFLVASIGGVLVVCGKFVASIFYASNPVNPPASNTAINPAISPTINPPINPTIEAWELWTLGIGFVVAILLFGLSLKFPSDKSKTLADMKKHFSSNPRQHQVMKKRS